MHDEPVAPPLILVAVADKNPRRRHLSLRFESERVFQCSFIIAPLGGVCKSAISPPGRVHS